MATNARGNFVHSREAIQVMAAIGGGAIVSVVSVVAAVAMKELAAYAASKERSPAREGHRCRVWRSKHPRNAVAHGVVETDILQSTGVAESRANLAGYGNAHPIGRIAQASEIAEVIVFLASPATSFMTGALVMADGATQPFNFEAGRGPPGSPTHAVHRQWVSSEDDGPELFLGPPTKVGPPSHYGGMHDCDVHAFVLGAHHVNVTLRECLADALPEQPRL